MKYLPCVEIDTSDKVTAAVIWLHGLGADGHDFASLVPELRLPENVGLRFIFPHAPSMPITINGGYVMPAWYDILEMNLERKIDESQLLASAAAVQALIEREIARGVKSERIILAGFSQGGAVVYQAGLSFNQPLAGILVMSSYLATYASLQVHPANQLTPILIQHGSEDSVVNEILGQRAFRFLKDHGCRVDYESYVMEHTLCIAQIEVIAHWIQSVLEG